ncbi:toxin-antitoxin system YwqK family antitoxin [Porphyromonas somerae]|uniref:toxin-antitoxin system YwqK family antitoxin n=1 Tax=Porphyromonas somerae TaxID=322095 RepID=UPI002A800E54|nr:toxin-antitoxin system YwqK family antitoxin [Porphyromonas somerae]MDY3883902.1 toxin-antitoxin system YwqK family antitoxin [Porphyromonas somerae]
MISKRVLKTAKGWLKKRDDLLKEERSALLNYIKPMKNVEALATTRWFVNEVIRVPEDQPKVNEAIKVAKRAKVDPLTYSSPMNILNTFKQYKIKEKAIDPDTVPELSNGRTVGPPSFSIRIYDVEDSKEGQLAMRKIINTHWGEDANPWCLLQGDGNGNLSSDAWKYWSHYDGVEKRVAFKDGKLLAFCANDERVDCWWDRQDEPHDTISFESLIPKDELERSASYEMDEYGYLYGPFNIHRGNEQNEVYEEWDDDGGQIMVRENYKNGKLEGVREWWYDNGQIEQRENYKNGLLDGLLERWNCKGNLIARGNYKNGKAHGLYEKWDKWSDGVLESREQYKEDMLDGIRELYYSDGSLKSRQMYSVGFRNGLGEEWHENGQLKSRINYNDDDFDGLVERWYKNGQLEARANYKNGELDGLSEWWYKNGQLYSRANYKDGDYDGLREIWHPNGQIQLRANYKDGLKEGLYEEWDGNGQVTDRTCFKGGNVVEDLTDEVKLRNYLAKKGIGTEGTRSEKTIKITLQHKKKGEMKL